MKYVVPALVVFYLLVICALGLKELHQMVHWLCGRLGHCCVWPVVSGRSSWRRWQCGCRNFSAARFLAGGWGL